MIIIIDKVYNNNNNNNDINNNKNLNLLLIRKLQNPTYLQLNFA